MNDTNGAPETLSSEASETLLSKVAQYGCLSICGIIILATAAGIMVVAVMICSTFLPMWGAVLLGVPLGIGAFVLLVSGESTPVEIAFGRCLVLLILIAILWPAVQRAKQNTEKAKARKQQTHLQRR